MFSIHKKLLLALKKVRIVKITPLRFPLPSKKSFPPVEFPVLTLYWVGGRGDFTPVFLVMSYKIIYQYPRSESWKLNMTQLFKSFWYEPLGYINLFIKLPNHLDRIWSIVLLIRITTPYIFSVKMFVPMKIHYVGISNSTELFFCCFCC